MNQITILPGPERRRRWGEAERSRILEVIAGVGGRRRRRPGSRRRATPVRVGAVAELYGLRPTQVFNWRRKARGMSELSFAPVTVTKEETFATWMPLSSRCGSAKPLFVFHAMRMRLSPGR